MQCRFNIMRLILFCLIFGVTTCATFIPRVYLIHTNQLLDTLQKQFPLSLEKGAGFVGLTIGVPQLALIPEQNRVSVDGDFVANAGKLGLVGHFTVSSSLRYDAEQSAIYLKETRLDSLQFKGGHDFPERVRSRIDRIVSESILKRSLHRFQPGELAALGFKIDVEAIDVVHNGILMKLRPVR